MTTIRRLASVILVSVFAVTLAAVFVGAEEPSAEDKKEKVNIEELFSVLGKMDMGREIVFMWWPDEIWASMAYNDSNADAMVGYTLISILTGEHLIFAPISARGGDAPAIVGSPVLSNDLKQEVETVPVHESFAAMLPGLIAFPAIDAGGNRIYKEDTEWLTVEVMFEGDDRPAKYTWHLPVDYPPFVESAYRWIDGRRNMDETLLSEDEQVFRFIGEDFRFNLQKGLIAAPIPKELFEMYLSTDSELSDEPILRKMIEQIINEYSFFLIMGPDTRNDPTRVEALAENAVVVNAAGETLQRDLEAEKTFSETDLAAEEYMSIIFPGLDGERPVKLILTDPETGEKSTFVWE